MGHILSRVLYQSSHNVYFFKCPGCKGLHYFTTSKGVDNSWVWNGDVNKPTVQPSIITNKDNPKKRCHLYINDGSISYLEDCHHELKGETVSMIDHGFHEDYN